MGVAIGSMSTVYQLIKTLMSSDEDFWLCGCSTEPPKQAKIFYRYVDVERLLDMANALHRNLEFTIEEEKESSIPFLDMLIQRRDDRLKSGWYTKPTDTGLMMDYHSLAPIKYKRNVVEGKVHRINQATSEWDEFTAGIEKAEKQFEKNRYPPQFYSQIVRKTVYTIIQKETHVNKNPSQKVDPLTTRPTLMLQYRGRESDHFARQPRSHNVSTIFT